MKPLRLYYFSPRHGQQNFGDMLSPIFVNRLTGRDIVRTSSHRCDLVALGSLLEVVTDRIWKRRLRFRFEQIIVWGTGTIKPGDPLSRTGLDILAVRGPKTRDRLGLPNDLILGDPGLLANELLETRPQKTHAWAIVPHFKDFDDPKVVALAEKTPNSILVNLSGDWRTVLAQIAAADRVISSSLHGIITADALGIPSVWASFSDRVIGGAWKFNDYYACFSLAAPNRVEPDGSISCDEMENELSLRPAEEIDALRGPLRKALLDRFGA